MGPELPRASVLVHPRLPDSAYPFGDLCGCGVAFKLAWQVCKSFGDGKKASPQLRDFLLESLGLVALATIADVMPLLGENRLLVKKGLEGIQGRPSVGVRALLEVSGCLNRSKLTAGTVGFQLAPRINAAGRLDAASKAVELLTTRDEALARELSSALNACNLERREVERKILEDARAMIEAGVEPHKRSAIIVSEEDWHPGVIGIVAGRLLDLYHRPTIVASRRGDATSASCRSIPGLDIHEALSVCSKRLITFGGHAAAAGFRIASADLDAFSREFEEYCQSRLTNEQKTRVLQIDAEVQLGMLSWKAVEELDRLEPHGVGNPRPVFMAESVRVVGPPRIVGESKSHVQIRFKQGEVVLKGVAFNMAEAIAKAKIEEGVECSIAFHASINEWNGRKETQLELRDVQLKGSAARSASATSDRGVLGPVVA